MNKNRWIKYHFPFYLWMAIIFIQSSFPSVDLPKVELISIDKLMHISVYGLLMFLCYISFIHQAKIEMFNNYSLISAIMVTTLFGLSDEFHQYFVPNRSSDIQDFIADFVGVIIAAIIIKYYFKKRYKLFQTI